MEGSRNGVLPPIEISSKSWIVTNGDTGDIIAQRGEYERREIASLTKIMTFYTIMQIVKKLEMNINGTYIETSYLGANIGGTTAGLQEGDVLTLNNLLHALMLPSGNDAAITLAEYFGELIQELFHGEENMDIGHSEECIRETMEWESNHINIFVREMNSNSRLLKLTQTQFTNPHGLTDPLNRSCALDISRLSAICMRNRVFRGIVRKKKYSCTGLNIVSKPKLFTWENTNRLLTRGFNGLKTGITVTAGGCLASSFQTKTIWYIIIILACRNVDLRFTETVKLIEHALTLTNQEKFKVQLLRKRKTDSTSLPPRTYPKLLTNNPKFKFKIGIINVNSVGKKPNSSKVLVKLKRESKKTLKQIINTSGRENILKTSFSHANIKLYNQKIYPMHHLL